MTLDVFPETSWPLVWHWCQSYWNQVADDFAPRTQSEFVDAQLARTAAKLGVWRGGELGGAIMLEPLSPVLAVGHCLFRRGTSRRDSFWGYRTTMPAIIQAGQVAFSMGYEKVAFFVFADNHAMRWLLARLGVAQEGLLRGQTQRNGAPIDVAVYGILKSEFLATFQQ